MQAAEARAALVYTRRGRGQYGGGPRALFAATQEAVHACGRAHQPHSADPKPRGQRQRLGRRLGLASGRAPPTRPARAQPREHGSHEQRRLHEQARDDVGVEVRRGAAVLVVAALVDGHLRGGGGRWLCLRGWGRGPSQLPARGACRCARARHAPDADAAAAVGDAPARRRSPWRRSRACPSGGTSHAAGDQRRGAWVGEGEHLARSWWTTFLCSRQRAPRAHAHTHARSDAHRRSAAPSHTHTRQAHAHAHAHRTPTHMRASRCWCS